MAHAEPATATLASKSPITSLVIDFIALDLLLYQTRDTGRVFARLLGMSVLGPTERKDSRVDGQAVYIDPAS
jgi:hypothetical protein